MTREEAIAILNNNWPGFPVSAESLLDMFIALGMLKLEDQTPQVPETAK